MARGIKLQPCVQRAWRAEHGVRANADNEKSRRRPRKRLGGRGAYRTRGSTVRDALQRRKANPAGLGQTTRRGAMTTLLLGPLALDDDAGNVLVFAQRNPMLLLRVVGVLLLLREAARR